MLESDEDAPRAPVWSDVIEINQKTFFCYAVTDLRSIKFFCFMLFCFFDFFPPYESNSLTTVVLRTLNPVKDLLLWTSSK